MLTRMPPGFASTSASVRATSFGAAHGGGVAEQDDRGVAGADRGAAVDGVDDLADLGDGERASQPLGCGAVGAAQAEADLADEFVLGWVGQSVLAVHVADGGAGHVEGGDGGAGGGAFDQVGG
jgi:hypothetical protein